MPVIAHSRGVLALEAMKGEAGWDAALNLPLPPRPGFYLLDEARRHVIAYLDWVTHDLAQGPPPDELRRGIDHAAAACWKSRSPFASCSTATTAETLVGQKRLQGWGIPGERQTGGKAR